MLDSAESSCDDGRSEEEAPLSLCIAAMCRHEDQPCIVQCCDTAGTRGEVKSDDILKIRTVGANTVLLAGNMSYARELLSECKPFIERYQVGGDDLAITGLIQGLVEAVRLRKRAMATAALSAELGVTYDEVFNWSQAHPTNPTWIHAWEQIRQIHLGAALIMSTFTDDEAAIVAIDPSGSVVWCDHYAAMGTGNNIASVILAQRDYDDAMKLDECVYRVIEAKVAAEKDLHVGQSTVLEFSVSGRASRGFEQGYVDTLTASVRKRMKKRVEFTLNFQFVHDVPGKNK